jgi:hypothetical protein
MLYSEVEIPDIQQRIKGLTDYSPQNFNQKLKEIFPEIIQKEAQYKDQNMQVKAKSTADAGTVVPIVLHLKVE